MIGLAYVSSDGGTTWVPFGGSSLVVLVREETISAEEFYKQNSDVIEEKQLPVITVRKSRKRLVPPREE